jgi:hypothetical protein
MDSRYIAILERGFRAEMSYVIRYIIFYSLFIVIFDGSVR